MKVSAILLSAGLSTRMRPLPHKGLLQWEGKALIKHQVQTLLHSNISEVIVVLGYEHEKLFQKIKDYPIKAIYNEHFHLGKCSSIIKGLETIDPSSDMILIISVDQPVSDKIINQLIYSLSNSNSLIAIPNNNGKKGHPILFSNRLKEELLSISEETKGLRNILKKYESYITETVIDHFLITQNINTPEDYRKALENNT